MGEHDPYGVQRFAAGAGQRQTFTAVTLKAPTGSWGWKTPNNVRTRILAVYANPVVSATVANREPLLQLRDPSNFHICSIEGGPVMTAATEPKERELFWIAGLGAATANAAANFTRQFPLWDWVLDEGYELLFEMFGGAAGDSSGEQRIFTETYAK